MKTDRTIASQSAGKPLIPGLLGLGLFLLAACATTDSDQESSASLVPQKEKSLEQSVADQRIEKEIGDLLFQADRQLFERVELEAEEGRVLLSGQVRDVQDRLDAVRLAWQVKGVQEVINELEVGDKASVSDFARDAWITSQLEGKLLLDEEVRSLDYSVETVNQVVYLMGVAQSQGDLNRIIAHAKNVEYVRRVVSHVRLKSAADS